MKKAQSKQRQGDHQGLGMGGNVRDGHGRGTWYLIYEAKAEARAGVIRELDKDA